MFDSDKWQEILGTVRKNKLRTFLTAFGVFWGIFMLVLLLGAGQGLQNGVFDRFGDGAKNSIFFSGAKTSLAHKGMGPGRQIQLTNEDLATIEREVPEVDIISPRNRLWGEYTINYKTENGSYQVFGTTPEFLEINGERVHSGRLLNQKDLDEKRKVIVIGEQVRQVLFKDKPAIGENVNIRGIHFKVVGTFSVRGNNGGRREERAYVPFNTLQVAYNQPNQVQLLGMVAQQGVKATVIEEKVKNVLAQRHKFSPEDAQALQINNGEKEYEQMMGLFNGINIFVWIVGIGTLIAGIVGVSNIMLIIVKERTREIGVRKALGATPFSVVSLILQESILITAFSGYLGLLAGVGLLDLVRYALESAGEVPFFSRPGVHLGVAVSATVLLVLAGALAGLVPALKAARIKPIEALRAD